MQTAVTVSLPLVGDMARAIAAEPIIVLPDEPTANLDRISSDHIFAIFTQLHAAGQTIIMVTHEDEYARVAGRVIKLDDGRIISDSRMEVLVQYP